MAVKNSQAGLSIVEMIVVVAIFAVVASVLFFNFSDFNTNVSIRNLSQEVALMVRKSQVYATGVHTVDGTAISSDTFASYGISFSAKTSSTGYLANNKRFVLFTDAVSGGTANRRYDTTGTCGTPAVGNECVEAFGITSGEIISSLCTESGCSSTNVVNVIFKRPSPDAIICIDTGGTCVPKSFLKVVLRSVRGVERSVTIWNTGQISTQ